MIKTRLSKRSKTEVVEDFLPDKSANNSDEDRLCTALLNSAAICQQSSQPSSSLNFNDNIELLPNHNYQQPSRNYNRTGGGAIIREPSPTGSTEAEMEQLLSTTRDQQQQNVSYVITSPNRSPKLGSRHFQLFSTGCSVDSSKISILPRWKTTVRQDGSSRLCSSLKKPNFVNVALKVEGPNPAAVASASSSTSQSTAVSVAATASTQVFPKARPPLRKSFSTVRPSGILNNSDQKSDGGLSEEARGIICTNRDLKSLLSISSPQVRKVSADVKREKMKTFRSLSFDSSIFRQRNKAGASPPTIVGDSASPLEPPSPSEFRPKLVKQLSKSPDRMISPCESKNRLSDEGGASGGASPSGTCSPRSPKKIRDVKPKDGATIEEEEGEIPVDGVDVVSKVSWDEKSVVDAEMLGTAIESFLNTVTRRPSAENELGPTSPSDQRRSSGNNKSNNLVDTGNKPGGSSGLLGLFVK